ncbi:MAG: GTP-binding protein HflX [Sphingobacteriales bacterium]|jgi:GTP-binding protein HflX
MKGQMHETSKEQETAVLVGVIAKGQNEKEISEHLEELDFLAQTAGAKVLKTFVQKLEHPDRVTFVGKGKLEEIVEYVKASDADMAIFDEELTPSQIRNLEKNLEVKILDRSSLILDIFANRAKTAQAKMQVELAQMQYMLPRLTNLWTHLSKQKGGIGMKGPGETEIETDRRIIRDKIFLLKKKLEKLDIQNETQRKGRDRMIRVALVGYTNVGKSTIMNLLSKSDVFAENKLFATLDTTVRKVVLGNIPFLLSDTVGFIRKLPHNLIESFKSTLDEVREADVLVHVVDISHVDFEQHMEVVMMTLAELGAKDKTILTVFNKLDAVTALTEEDLTPEESLELKIEGYKKTWMASLGEETIFMSALKRENVEELRKTMYETIKDLYLERYPYEKVFYY